MASGVKVVGGSGPATEGSDGRPKRRDTAAVGGENNTAAAGGAESTAAVGGADNTAGVENGAAAARRRQRRHGTVEPGTGRRTAGGKRRAGVVALAIVAVLGVAGTVGFGLAWQGLQSRQVGESQATAAARSFLVDLTNFDAKTVDADFSAVSSMATGPFASQAQRFFNSTIRQDLQKALASSRGQIRSMDVQSYGGGQATVYAVVDQLYVNDKLTSPQTDVLRLVVNMAQVGARWKVADVTVLQGPTLGSGTKSATATSSGNH
jgi:Mce-associated membrane protein